MVLLYAEIMFLLLTWRWAGPNFSSLISTGALGVSATTIDQEIAAASDDLQNLNFFHLSPNNTLFVKVNLDMVLTLDQYSMTESGQEDIANLFMTRVTSRRKRKVKKQLRYRWPGGKVFYEISSQAQYARTYIRDAIELWEKFTCLRFFEDRKSPNRVVVVSGSGCYSNVGMIGGVQELGFGVKCSWRSAVHELGHVIGFIHEHMRYDRDNYITIHWNLVPDNMKKNFRKFNSEFISLYTDYDYTSIMHYSGLGIMTTKDPFYQTIIGSSESLSFKDIKTTNLMYGCRAYGRCPPKKCPFNGFVFYSRLGDQPKCVCWCDSGNISQPLVPCCTLCKEVAGPNLLAALSEYREGDKCTDLLPNCAELKSRGMCRVDLIRMVANCRKTCDLCNARTDLCMDYENNCEILAEDFGACHKKELRSTMEAMCPKSCGLCTSPLSECNLQHSLAETSRSAPRQRLPSILNMVVLSLLCHLKQTML